MKSARETAADILVAVEKNGAYSSTTLQQALRQGVFADERDKKLVTSLVYSVTEHRINIDSLLSSFLTKPLGKLPPFVLQLLRIGAVQILYFDKIPVSAAVNESVKLAKKRGFAYASGMINAVLRRVISAAEQAKSNEEKTTLAERFSYPEELVRLFVNQFGEDETERMLTVFEGRRPVFIRVNTLKTTSAELIRVLKSENVSVRETEVENCLEISDFGDITTHKSFSDGLFHVQDMSSQLCVEILGAKPGETIIDCCAAPGGKSFTCSQYMNNTGTLISCDLYKHKTELIEKTANRLGITCIKTVCADATCLPEPDGSADRVLCDCPCSGFGVIGRKPEIKYKSLDEAAELPKIQAAILERGAALVKKGGRLVYSTCTLNEAENGDVCAAFLRTHHDFSLCTDKVYRDRASANGFITVLPTEKGGDGFFIAAFERSPK